MSRTISEYIRDLKHHTKEMDTAINKALQKAAIDTHDRMTRRIFNAGLAQNGTTIGRYSIKPALSSGNTGKSKKVYRALAGSKAKRRQLEWVTVKNKGKNAHLFVVEGGYKEIRAIEGLPTSRVDLRFTNQLFKDWSRPPVRKGKHKLIKVLKPINDVKAAGNEEHFGKKIFDWQTQEIEFFKRRMTAELKKIV